MGVEPLSLEGGLHPLGLERRSRSITPPAASEKHLTLSANDSVRYRLKMPYRDGAAHVIFEPLDHRTIRQPWRRRPVAGRSTAACYVGDPRDSDSIERKAGLYSIPTVDVAAPPRHQAMETAMIRINLKINGSIHTLDVPPEMPLLWALRDKLNLVGTKYSCGIGICGSCTVLVNGNPLHACVVPASAMAGKEIITIEGLSPDGSHPVQKAWNDEDVPQCGYCQAGQILTAVALLARNPAPSDEDIDVAMSGNLCRCGTYPRIRKAIKRAAEYASRERGAS